MRQDFESCRFSFIMDVEVFLIMKYPKFLNENNNTIGVCAMSSGVGHKLDIYDECISFDQQRSGRKIFVQSDV